MTLEPCELGKQSLRETTLPPVLDQLMSDFFSGISLPIKGPRVSTETAGDAIKRLEQKLARMGERYDDGDMEKAEYQAKRDVVRRQLAEYEDQTIPLPEPTELLTLAEQWSKGDPAPRWAVLSALFERIELNSSGEIAGFKARADRVAASGCSSTPPSTTRTPTTLMTTQ